MGQAYTPINSPTPLARVLLDTENNATTFFFLSVEKNSAMVTPLRRPK
jgi:hypothetical protein